VFGSTATAFGWTKPGIEGVAVAVGVLVGSRVGVAEGVLV
jgi:hypothetical protein